MKLPAFKLPALKKPDFSNPTVRLQALLLGGAFAIIGLLVMAIIVPATSNPWFCGQACHNMNPQYQTWKVSSHKNINCTACHVDATAWGLFEEKVIIGVQGMINTALRREEKPINEHSVVSQQHLSSDRCKRCHANENRKFTFSEGIIMNHNAHDDAGINCAVCHNRVAHEGAEEYEPIKSEWKDARGHKWNNFMTMKEGCLRCHSTNSNTKDMETLDLIVDSKKPPTACATCHTKDFKLPEGHGKNNWRSVHGQLAQKNFGDCFKCHEAGAKYDNRGTAWCEACHDKATVRGFRITAGLPEPEKPTLEPIKDEGGSH